MSRPLTVLVADDDPDLRDILRSTLEPAGFQVIEAPDGQAALEAIHAHLPHLVILDYAMPKMDGPQVCRELKQDVLLRHLPVIILTGRSEVHDKIQGLDAGADDYVLKPFDPQELLARVRMVVRRTTQELEANPLTKLPGNISIQKEIDDRISRHASLAVCYADLNHFKAFNDHYGFERGDQVIRQTAQILIDTVKALGNPTDFIGHIGGDDFMVITTPDRADAVCQEILRKFDAMIPKLYDPEDRTRGYFEHADRRNQPIHVGFIGIAIAVVTNREHALTHLGQIAAIGAELKSLAKRSDASQYVVDRRKD